ncbi:MAG TPA: hypothetical protein VGD15_10075 [Kribbella sp.]
MVAVADCIDRVVPTPVHASARRLHLGYSRRRTLRRRTQYDVLPRA